MPTNKKSKGGKKARKKQQQCQQQQAKRSINIGNNEGAGSKVPSWPAPVNGKLELAQIPRKPGLKVHDWGPLGESLRLQIARQGPSGSAASLAAWLPRYQEQFVPLDLAGAAAEAVGYQDALERFASESTLDLVLASSDRLASSGALDEERHRLMKGWKRGMPVPVLVLMPGHPLHKERIYEVLRGTGDQLIAFKPLKAGEDDGCPFVRSIGLLYCGALIRTVRRYEPRHVLDRHVRELSAVPEKMRNFFAQSSPSPSSDDIQALMSSLSETGECGVCQEDSTPLAVSQLKRCLYCSYEICPTCLDKLDSCPQCRFQYRIEADDTAKGNECHKFHSLMASALARKKETRVDEGGKETLDLDAQFKKAKNAFKTFILFVNGDPKSQMLLKREKYWPDLMVLNTKWRTQAVEEHGKCYSPGCDFFFGLKEQHTPINNLGREFPQAKMTKLWQEYTQATMDYRVARQSKAQSDPKIAEQMLQFAIKVPGQADTQVQVLDPSIAADLIAVDSIRGQFKSMQSRGSKIYPANEKTADVASLFGCDIVP